MQRYILFAAVFTVAAVVYWLRRRPRHTSSSPSVSSSARPLAGLDASYVLVDTAAKLREFMDAVEGVLASSPAPVHVNVDFEGVNLCKTGQVCLGQFQVSGHALVWLLDFIAIANPFALLGCRLKRVMESPAVRKVFFDPRNDSDALLHQFGVRVRGALDLQLAEVAHRRHVRALRVKYVAGLGRVLEQHVGLAVSVAAGTRVAAQAIKARGKTLFAPELGGSYEVFAARPLAHEIIEYCVADILFFDLLRHKLFLSLPEPLQAAVLAASELRLTECLQPGYLPHGQHKAIAPAL